MRKVLTDRALKALRPAAAGARYEIFDAVVPGLAVRVTATGSRSFVLVSRYPGSKHPTRRAIGEYGAVTLDQARAEARKWLALLQQGKDPKVEQERARQAELRKQAHTFTNVAEEYIKSHASKKRTARVIARDIRKELIGRWGARPVADITREDVKTLIKDIADRPAPYMAHLVLAYSKSLFNWALEADYGLEASPAASIKPGLLVGAKEPRQRVLSDAEIAALWRASEAIGYPFGPLYQLLLLTGTRLNEAAGARWREIDLDKRLWVIPPERFKSNAAHLVPLTHQALAVIEPLQRFAKGDCLFSSTWGGKPVSGFSKAKDRIDALMAAELGKLEPWRIHDIRRTVRTRLASLKVSDTVAEMVIGHGKKGLQRVYDQHQYEPELREALTLWGAKLRDIVTPSPENVVPLHARV
jgi:integrase